MARQAGNFKIRGTIGDLCFYKMDEDYFVKQKSSITPERYRKDKAFAARRESSERLKQSSPLASKLYRRLPKEKKVGGLWRQVCREVRALLTAGKDEAAVEAWFMKCYMGVRKQQTKRSKAIVRPSKAVQKIQPKLNVQLFIVPHYNRMSSTREKKSLYCLLE